MNLTKSIMTIAISSAMMMPLSSCQKAERVNPLLQESELPFGAPDFNKIQTSDYLPAFEAGIKEKRENIQAIIEDRDRKSVV